MKVLPPFGVTPENLTSNVAITETEWTAGTYSTGDLRYVGTKLYEVVADPSTSDEPTVGAAKPVPTWIAVGSINRFKMFDFAIGDATISSGDIVVTINSGSNLINGVALFEVVGSTVRVVVTDETEGVVYDRTKSLQDFTGINNYYQYFFAPYNNDNSAVFVDLPAYVGADIEVTVSSGGGATQVGEMVVGTLKTIGVTLINFSFGIEDFSRKERDDFGKFRITEKRFAKLSEYDVVLLNNQNNAAFKALANLRATPAVYIGAENFPETITFGFYKDFSCLRTGPSTSEMTLEIEGLV